MAHFLEDALRGAISSKDLRRTNPDNGALTSFYHQLSVSSDIGLVAIARQKIDLEVIFDGELDIATEGILHPEMKAISGKLYQRIIEDKETVHRCIEHVSALRDKINTPMSTLRNAIETTAGIFFGCVIFGDGVLALVGLGWLVAGLIQYGLSLSALAFFAPPGIPFILVMTFVVSLFVMGAVILGFNLYDGHHHNLLIEEKHRVELEIKRVCDQLTALEKMDATKLPVSSAEIRTLESELQELEKAELKGRDDIPLLGKINLSLYHVEKMIVTKNRPLTPAPVSKPEIVEITIPILAAKAPMAEDSSPGSFSGALFAHSSIEMEELSATEDDEAEPLLSEDKNRSTDETKSVSSGLHI